MPEPTENTEVNQEQPESKPESFEAWLDAQPAEVKELYDQHVSGLKNTVAATRQERDNLKGEVQRALKQAEKGSELEKTLNETLLKLESTERRASFLEDAMKPEIGCSNPRVAYALAVAENLFTRTGAPDWQSLKDTAPELFGMRAPKGNAGNGTNAPVTKTNDMNTIIRHAAGVQ